jgi:hypothetical protein
MAGFLSAAKHNPEKSAMARLSDGVKISEPDVASYGSGSGWIEIGVGVILRI